MESASKAYAVCQALPDNSAASTAVSATRQRLGDAALHEARERLEGEPAGDHRPLAGRARDDEAALEVVERVVDVLEPERRRCDPLDEVDALDEPVVGQQRERALRFVEVDERLGDPALGAVGEAAEHRGHERGELVDPRARHHRARQRASLRELAPPVVVERDLDEQRRDGSGSPTRATPAFAPGARVTPMARRSGAWRWRS